MTRSCTNCIHFNVCKYRNSHSAVSKTYLDVSIACAYYRPDAKTAFENAVNGATDEIFGSISVAATGNFWFSEYWNLFCYKEQLCGSRYFVVNLERYGNSEECQDFEFDTEETNTDTEVELRIAIEQIIRRNMFLLEEML